MAESLGSFCTISQVARTRIPGLKGKSISGWGLFRDNFQLWLARNSRHPGIFKNGLVKS